MPLECNSIEHNFIKKRDFCEFSKAHDFHQKSHNRKNLVPISSIVKNLEAVIQKFVEFTEVVVQGCYVKIRKKTPEMESLFKHSYKSKVFSNKFLKDILRTPIRRFILMQFHNN